MANLIGIYTTGSTGGGKLLLAFAIAPAISSVIAVGVAVTLFFAQMPGEPPGSAEVVAGWLFATAWMVIALVACSGSASGAERVAGTMLI